MQIFLYAAILCFCSAEFAVKALNAPGLVKFIPELFSVFAGLYVIFAGAKDRFRHVSPKYWIVFGATALLIACGVLSNQVGSGPMLAGMRYYLRAIPFFFLPAVLSLSDDQWRKQFKLVLIIAFAQLPVALFQRYIVWSHGRVSGDSVAGTMYQSGVLSIFLICVALLLTGLLLRKRIGLLKYGVLFLIVLLPTALNETKATVLLLPLGLFTTLIAGAAPGKRLQVLFTGTACLVVFGAAFVPIYNLTQVKSPHKRNIVEFFTDQEQFNKYLSVGKARLGTTKYVGRGDAIEIPLEFLMKDPVKLGLGLGIGNVSHSEMGANYTGDYYGMFTKFLLSSFTVFILEIGVFGVALVFLIYWLIFRDVVALARVDASFFGALAVGWIGVVAVIAVSTFYIPLHVVAAASYPFWYLSGFFAARRQKLLLAV